MIGMGALMCVAQPNMMRPAIIGRRRLGAYIYCHRGLVSLRWHSVSCRHQLIEVCNHPMKRQENNDQSTVSRWGTIFYCVRQNSDLSPLLAFCRLAAEHLLYNVATEPSKTLDMKQITSAVAMVAFVVRERYLWPDDPKEEDPRRGWYGTNYDIIECRFDEAG